MAMVGVAGKFAGCETCRDRRVKCGNERPICRKCIKTGRDCQGYERPRTWINGTQAEQGRVSSHDRRPPERSGTSQRRLDVSRARRNEPISPLVRISDAPSTETQVLALHSNILSLEPLFESSLGSTTLPPLLNCLPSLTKSSPLLEYAVRALCLIHLGVTKKEDGLIKESAHINNKAVARMQKAVDSPRSAASVETLAASICLYMYEQVACTAEKGTVWRILFQGSSSLVKQRGPSSFKRFPDHHFFVRLFRNDALNSFLCPFYYNTKIIQCFVAMSRSKSTFLAEPDWLTIPWEEIPKSDMDRLFDIQFHLPAIFERQAQLEKDRPSSIRKIEAQKLLDRSYKVIEMFENWYDELHSRMKEPLFWFIPRQTHKEGSVESLGFDMCFLFPNYLQFVNLNVAFLHLYYWAALSLIYHKIQHIHNLVSDKTSEFPKYSPISPDLPEPVRASKRSTATLSLLYTPPLETSTQKDPFNSTHSTSSSEPLITTFLANPKAEGSSPSHPRPLNPKYSEGSVLSLAHLICKSLPYALNRTIHSLGPDHSAWPVWCALQVFKRRGLTEELEWCTKMLDMWGREGWKFGGQMGRVEWE